MISVRILFPMFPQWKGSAFVSGLATQTLNRITFDGQGGAKPAERWDIGHRIRVVRHILEFRT